MQKYFFDLPIEVFLIIIHFPSELFKIFVNLDKVNPNPTKENDIIIVERWFAKNILHIFLKKYLEKLGFRVFWINYPLTKGSFSIASISLQKFIEKNNLNNIILIGISGGGVTCIEYLQRLDGWKKVKKFISISSPIYGTSLAFLVSFFKSGKELSPNSSYINQLKDEKLLNLKNIITISSKFDEMVPSKFNQIVGANNIVFDMIGHNYLHTFYRPTYLMLKNILV